MFLIKFTVKHYERSCNYYKLLHLNSFFLSTLVFSFIWSVFPVEGIQSDYQFFPRLVKYLSLLHSDTIRALF